MDRAGSDIKAISFQIERYSYRISSPTRLQLTYKAIQGGVGVIMHFTGNNAIINTMLIMAFDFVELLY